MKRLFILITLLVAVPFMGGAKQVDKNTARTIGLNFINNSSGIIKERAPTDLTWVYTAINVMPDQSTGDNPYPAFYVFNFTGTPGFVVVAGDDIVAPILGYSIEGWFSLSNIPPATASWLGNYEEQIKNAVAQKLMATPEIESAWNEYSSAGGGSSHSGKGDKAVEPLIKLYWNQEPYYNKKCPKIIRNGKDTLQTVTGCVATAMAMVMKYHNYPKVGTGSYSYGTDSCGTLSANFGETWYKWDLMPDSLGKNSPDSIKDAVAILMRHCGIAAEMGYGVEVSGAWEISEGSDRHCAENALKTYFGYDPSLRGLSRLSYTDAEWTGLLNEDLDAGLPLLYAAWDVRPIVGGGHAFICDGYDNNGLYHFNWGWGGQSNGYFQINALNPGSSMYACNHQVIKGVRPLSGQGKYFNLNLRAPVTLTSNVIHYKDSISVATDVYNNGKVTFQGKIAAAIFDTNEVLIGFVDIIQPITLQPGEYTGRITFDNSGMPDMLPGKYMIGLMYNTVGNDWMEVNDTLSFVNFPVMEVINPDVIEMASVMTVLPGTEITEGNQATVKLEIRNTGSAAFSGKLNLAIHDIEGNYMTSLAEIDNVNLPAGSSSGQLTFSTNRISVTAASYLFTLWYKPSGEAEYKLVGSSRFGNPVRVQVNASPLSPDLYEPNNTAATASVLPVSFSENTANLKLNNANCHVGKDIDYYKIELPANFSYIIHARLEASEYDTTMTHPLNGIWNYKVSPDTTWASSCNNSGPHKFEAMNGGTVWFVVQTNYIAQTGMYQLNINIQKNPLGIGESSPAGTLVIYPNPANSEIFLKDLTGKTDISECIVTSIDGRELLRMKPVQQDGISRIPVSNLSNGLYLLQVVTSSGNFSRKILIQR